MTLDEAITHAKEVAKQNEEDAITYRHCKNNKKNLFEIGVAEQAKEKCLKCAEEHRQLALWLQELKVYKSIFEDEPEGDDEDIAYGYVRMKIYKEVYKKWNSVTDVDSGQAK